MAILAKCKHCGRLGGYAVSSEDTVCARCKHASKKSVKTNEGNEDKE